MYMARFLGISAFLLHVYGMSMLVVLLALAPVLSLLALAACGIGASADAGAGALRWKAPRRVAFREHALGMPTCRRAGERTRVT